MTAAQLLVPLAAASLAAAVAAFVLGRLLARGTALAAWQDVPNERSLHARPVPRVGGLGLHAGWVAAALALAPAGGVWPLPPAALAGAALVLAVSLADDRRGLPAGRRLAVQAVAAAVAVLGAGWPAALGALPSAAWPLATWPAPLAAVALVLAVLWMTNLYNFMDGADGLAGGMAVAGFGGLALAAAASAPALATLCAGVAGGALGFLRFNFPPARVFMGDSGSAPLGFLAAAAGIAGIAAGAWPAWLPALAFLPFVVDASFTLMLRLVRGERVWEPHREHGYQKLVRMGWSHRRTACCAYVAMGTCTGLALVLLRFEPAVQWRAAALALALALGARGAIEATWHRRGIGAPASARSAPPPERKR